MGLDETLLERLHRLLPRHGDVVEKQMVGGRSFSLAGRMCCGVTRGGLMVRVGRDQVASALDEPFVSRMSMGGRSLAAFVVVAPEGLVTDAALEAWVQRAVGVVAGEASSMPTATKADPSADPSRSAHSASAAPATSAADRFAELAEHLAQTTGVTPPVRTGGRGFGSSALKADGSIFAMLTHDRLVVKLPAARVTELIEAGIGSPFTGGKSVPMRQWLSVETDERTTWLTLAREALAFVGRR